MDSIPEPGSSMPAGGLFILTGWGPVAVAEGEGWGIAFPVCNHHIRRVQVCVRPLSLCNPMWAEIPVYCCPSPALRQTSCCWGGKQCVLYRSEHTVFCVYALKLTTLNIWSQAINLKITLTWNLTLLLHWVKLLLYFFPQFIIISKITTGKSRLNWPSMLIQTGLFWIELD